jgi:hypothetical protein
VFTDRVDFVLRVLPLLSCFLIDVKTDLVYNLVPVIRLNVPL